MPAVAYAIATRHRHSPPPPAAATRHWRSLGHLRASARCALAREACGRERERGGGATAWGRPWAVAVARALPLSRAGVWAVEGGRVRCVHASMRGVCMAPCRRRWHCEGGDEMGRGPHSWSRGDGDDGSSARAPQVPRSNGAAVVVTAARGALPVSVPACQMRGVRLRCLVSIGRLSGGKLARVCVTRGSGCAAIVATTRLWFRVGWERGQRQRRNLHRACTTVGAGGNVSGARARARWLCG